MTHNRNLITSQLIQKAHITESMRVLDFGCGTGAVSFLLAKVVGSNGEVIGVDRNGRVLEIAKKHAIDHAISNVHFLTMDVADPLPDVGLFDAVVGRRILMYLPDPNDALKKLSTILNKNGIMAFQEIDATASSLSITQLPLHQKVNGWIWQTLQKEGANTNMGFTLPSLLQKNGFSIEGITAEANIQGQKAHAPLATIVQAMSNRIVEYNVASMEEINIENLEERLRDERHNNEVFVGNLTFSIWARKT